MQVAFSVSKTLFGDQNYPKRRKRGRYSSKANGCFLQNSDTRKEILTGAKFVPPHGPVCPTPWTKTSQGVEQTLTYAY